MLLFLAAEDPLEHVLPHTYFHLGPVGITNHMIMVLVAALLMLLIFPRLFRRPQSEAPTGTKNFFESILEFLRVEVFRPALKEHTDRFVPFLWTLFFFILFCNLLGALPLAHFFELITLGHVKHLGGAATGNISTTAALAICAFFFIHVNGIDTVARALMDGTYGQHGHHEEHTSNGAPGHEAAHDREHMRAEGLPADVPGDLRALGNPTAHYGDDQFVAHHSHEAIALAAITHEQEKMTPVKAILAAVPIYLWNFAPHPFRPKPGESAIMWLADFPMFCLLLVLELIGAAIKPFALCVRLFANMVAGHVLLAVLIGLIVTVPGILQVVVGIPVAGLDLGIQLLELFVAFLQAYIFTFLTTLFIASAVAPEH
jgi:F0F1-type ATP synthase membrane subunit a